MKVRDVLVQQGLHKVLKQREGSFDDDEWDDMNLRGTSLIRLCLAEVLYNVMGETVATSLWSKLENLYMTKSLSNRLFMKHQLYNLRMKEGQPLLEHLNRFNRIVTELVSMGITHEEEEKALLLLNSLPRSYEHLVTTLLHGKETIKFEDVTANYYLTS